MCQSTETAIKELMNCMESDIDFGKFQCKFVFFLISSYLCEVIQSTHRFMMFWK